MDLIKKHKITLSITMILCLVPMIFGLIMWDKLPDMMPTHFNFNNEVDGYMSKTSAVILLPVILAASELLCVICAAIDPKKTNIASKSLVPILWFMSALSWITSAITYAAALKTYLNSGAIIFIFIGCMFIAIGNYMPKNAQNYTVGIKTPWALNDENNWNYTNRLAAKSFIISGIIVLIIGIVDLTIKQGGYLLIIAFVILLLAGLIPVIASYVYYARHKDENA